MPVEDNSAPPSLSIGILLIDGFALMSYASIIEPFRAANVLTGATLYRWHHITLDGGPVNASNGAMLVAEGGIDDPARLDMLFILAAGDPAAFRDERCFAWLRQQARRGVRLAGISGGPFILARAGLLDGYRATIHWEHADALREEFPQLTIEPHLYVIDRTRMTCAGGTAGLDLGIALIQRDHGSDLAARVGEWFIRTEPRQADHAQRPSARERYGTVDERLLRMLAAMEQAIEEPLPRATLARAAGLSLRQLERLSRQLLGASVAETYLALRLDHAAHLLRTTGMSVMAAAIASGFRSTSHFSRRFHARFGVPPSRGRS